MASAGKAPARAVQRHVAAAAALLARTHMGAIGSRKFFGHIGMNLCSREFLRSGPEPFEVTRLVAELDQTHIRPASMARHQDPAIQRARLRRAKPFSISAVRPCSGSVARPDLPGLIGSR